MEKMKKIWGTSCFDHYFLGFLVAIELLMSFTFLGYIHIPPISVTTAYIPILIAGCLFGPAQSALIGTVFGVASMYKASASYVMPADAVFSPFLSGSAAGSLALSVGTRALFGFLIGSAFRLGQKRKHCRLLRGAVAAMAPKMHSLLVYGTMGVVFPGLGYTYRTALHWKWDDSVFALICVAAVEALRAVYHSHTIQNIKGSVDQSVDNPYSSGKMNLFFAAFESFLLCMAVFAAAYFSQREKFMLEQHGVVVSDVISSDLFHLQIQFLIAFLGLNIISVIMLMVIYKYMSYKEYRGEMDELTGVMGRRMFLYHCDKAQGACDDANEKTGWFLFVDVDYFKTVNDTFGHGVGDKVLKEIAAGLLHMAGDEGKVGRIGGDEFAVLIETPMEPQEMKRRLERFLEEISGILPDQKTSCSIGAYQFVFPKQVKRILTETDELLYQAKENGRACYVMGTCAGG